MSSFNHEAFVGEAVESVLAQDFTDWEFIIRDDGSHDDTVKNISRFKDPRIRFLPSSGRMGGAASLNLCIQEAQGDYIAIMNSDDVMLPRRLSTEAGILRQHPNLGAVFSLAEAVDTLGNRLSDGASFYCSVFSQENRSRHHWLKFFFEKGNCLCHPTALLRRSAFTKLGPYDPLMVQLPDFDFWVRLCAEYEIHVHQEPLLRFRLLRDGGNASADSPRNRERGAYELTKVLAQYAGPCLLPQLHNVFPKWVNADDGDGKRLLGLARAALAQPSSPHHLFALDCLREYAKLKGEDIGVALEELLALSSHARPFSMLYSKGHQCRIFCRGAAEEFSQRCDIAKTLHAGVPCHEVVALPVRTAQTRLNFDGGFSSVTIISLTITDSAGREIWSLSEHTKNALHVAGDSELAIVDSRFLLLGTGKAASVSLPVLDVGTAHCLHYSIEINFDADALVRENQRLARELRSLKGALSKADNAPQPLSDAKSIKSWLVRLLGTPFGNQRAGNRTND